MVDGEGKTAAYDPRGTYISADDLPPPVTGVWAIFSASLDGDDWIGFDLVELRSSLPQGMVVTTREAFGSSGPSPAGLGDLPCAYSHGAPRPPVIFAERLVVLP